MSQQKDEFEKLITRKISQLSHEINRVKEENLELHKTVRDLSERLEQFEDTMDKLHNAASIITKPGSSHKDDNINDLEGENL